MVYIVVFNSSQLENQIADYQTQLEQLDQHMGSLIEDNAWRGQDQEIDRQTFNKLPKEHEKTSRAYERASNKLHDDAGLTLSLRVFVGCVRFGWVRTQCFIDFLACSGVCIKG